MKASFLCGVHYEGSDAHAHVGWPCPPALFDSNVGQRSFDHFFEYARLADELGFDWISVSEHHFSPHILTPSLGAVAGALTQVVPRARIALLGPLAPVNNPIRIAEEIAMLDQMSHGRLVVLPLRGTPQEYNAFGPLTTEASRAMTHEALELIQKSLTEPRPFNWDGEYWKFPTVAVWPRPVQKPYPPMYYSGNNLESARFAAAHRLGLCTSFLPPPIVALTVAAYREEAARVGWEPAADQIVHRNHIVVADTADEAAALAANFVPLWNRERTIRNMTTNRSGTGVDAVLSEWAHRYRAGQLQFSGTPDAVVERIHQFQDETGVGVVDLIFAAGPTPPTAVRRSLELFGREVLPRIRELGAETKPVEPRVAAV